MSEQPGASLAVPEDGAVEEIFDGEVVGEDRAPGLPPVPARAVIVLRPVVVVVRVVLVVARDERTRTAGRHAAYVPAGAVVAWRRWRRGRSLAGRMAHQLALQGDQDKALAMLAHEAAERTARHQRARGRVAMLIELARNAHWITLATVGGMLGVGIAVGNAAWPFETAAAVIRDAVTAARWGWRISFAAAPVATMVALHEAGRRAGDLAPGWSLAAKQDGEERGLVVTADGIVVALQNLPIPELKKAFKDNWQPAFRLTPVRDGEGYSAIFSVPMGVTPEMIADKNKIFARNLHRAPVEVWPTDAERAKIAPAGFVSLWVANPGVLDRAAPSWPLLNEGGADVFKGVPIGVTARGLPVSAPIVGNNFSIGGLMGQGKSNACRVVMLGAALDPLAELNVHVFAYNGDFDAYAPRLARYVKGAEEDQIDAAMETLLREYEDVGEREQMLADLGAKKVTRALAQKYPELRPVLTLFSECHELFGHKDYGEEATELAVKTIRRARKTAKWMGFDTQDARADAIPPKLLGLVSIRNCLPVMTWRANDGFLWDGAFKAGVRATELRPGRDVGRSITTGASDEQFEIVKWHYIFSDDDTGQDDAAPVIARAMANVAPGTAVSGSLPQAAAVVRDLLADVAEVAGPDRVKLADLPARLRKLAPSWGAYRQLNGVQLKQLLDGEGVRTTRPKNVLTLDPADLRRALAERGELAVPGPQTASRSPPQACA